MFSAFVRRKKIVRIEQNQLTLCEVCVIYNGRKGSIPDLHGRTSKTKISVVGIFRIAFSISKFQHEMILVPTSLGSTIKKSSPCRPHSTPLLCVA